MQKLTREEQMQIMEECTVDAEQMAHHDLPPMRIAIWAAALFAFRTKDMIPEQQWSLSFCEKEKSKDAEETD